VDEREKENEKLVAKFREIHKKSRSTYGSQTLILIGNGSL
jgi:hypothetical protein